jgi:uncharacterized repeat protein (TIGR02543 family)
MGKTLLAYGDSVQDSVMLDGLVRNVVRDVLGEFSSYVQNDTFRDWLVGQGITDIDGINAYEGPLDASEAGLSGLASQCALRHFTALESIDLSGNGLTGWYSISIPGKWGTIDLSDNDFTASDVNQILTDLAVSEASSPRTGSPSIDLSGNAEATYDGLVAAVALIAAGWSVTLENSGTWQDGYTLTFDANNGTGDAPDAMSPLYGQTVTIPGANTLTRTGYRFSGWNTLATGAGTTYAEDSSYVMPNSNTTLYAKWTPVYSIAYDGNGLTGGSVPPTETYLTGTPVTIAYPESTNLTKIGYVFSHWNSNPGGTGTITYEPGKTISMPSQNITLYAIWTIAVYDITYELYGGTNNPSNPATYTIGTATITLAAPTRTGYTFGGWYEDDEFTVPITQIPIGSYGEIEVHAKFTLNSYTLSFNKGSADGGNAPASKTVGYNTHATLPVQSDATMYKTGHYLSRWHAQSTLSDSGYAPGTLYVMPAANTTLYAAWSINNSYTVVFNANGGSGSMSNQSIVQGMSANLTQNAFTRSGYVFLGWALSSGGSVAYADKASYTMGSSGVTLYAVWEFVDYKVTFNANLGSGSMSDQVITKGTTEALTANAFTRTGYTFAGWALSAGGAVTYADKASFTMGSSNVTLYARWSAIPYTVTFASNGGSSVPSQTVNYNQLVTEPNAPTRVGYTFARWVHYQVYPPLYTTWDFSSHRITEDTTLIAFWTEVLVTSLNLSPMGGSAEYKPYTETVNTTGTWDSSRTRRIDVIGIYPSNALNKTVECIVRSGGSLIQSLQQDSYGSVLIIMKKGVTGVVKITVRPEGNPGLSYYYEYTLTTTY